MSYHIYLQIARAVYEATRTPGRLLNEHPAYVAVREHLLPLVNRR